MKKYRIVKCDGQPEVVEADDVRVDNSFAVFVKYVQGSSTPFLYDSAVAAFFKPISVILEG